MTTSRPATPSPAEAGAIPLERLLADQPPVLDVGDSLEQIQQGRRVVLLDDDPTGTQTIADLPVLTSWSVADLQWALQQPTTGFFVLTNTRSLSESDAAERNRQVVDALHHAAEAEQVSYVLASRSDSTLRGYFPLETDVLSRELAARGTAVDGVVICPAYVEPGRLTIDSRHWTRTPDGMIPVSQSEFAKDASFGYRSSDLRDWVEEKTAGRIPRDEVATITLTDIRVGGPDRVGEILAGLQNGQPVVVDTVEDADQQVVVLALLRAEAADKNFIYRIGPSFVRARTGQHATPPVDGPRLREIFAPRPDASDETRPATKHGLIAVGSHVGLTTRQLDRLRDRGKIIEVELTVPTLLDDSARERHVNDIAGQAATMLRNNDADSDIVIRTSRTLVTGDDAVSSLVIARTVSAALVGTVREIVSQVRPAFVLAKGGITSSDTATEGLGIRRAWCRGTMLPGIISLWEPVTGPAQGIPYIVFAGNVGDDNALAAVVDTLRSV
ncbi:MAG TPA: four-carbon acid sugar kinase family protein [Propionibacteriaceae bacterium]|nr:four-carbon acid sugar kinase family protein [Propionibacteriaceae bacterium]